MGEPMTDEEWDEFERKCAEEARRIEEAKSPEQKAKEAAEREKRRIYFETSEVRRKFAMRKLRQIRAADAAYLKKQKNLQDFT